MLECVQREEMKRVLVTRTELVLQVEYQRLTHCLKQNIEVQNCFLNIGRAYSELKLRPAKAAVIDEFCIGLAERASLARESISSLVVVSSSHHLCKLLVES